jgi:hypothetical protein
LFMTMLLRKSITSSVALSFSLSISLLISFKPMTGAKQWAFEQDKPCHNECVEYGVKCLYYFCDFTVGGVGLGWGTGAGVGSGAWLYRPPMANKLSAFAPTFWVGDAGGGAS